MLNGRVDIIKKNSEITIRVFSVLPDKVYEEHIYNCMAYRATDNEHYN